MIFLLAQTIHVKHREVRGGKDLSEPPLQTWSKAALLWNPPAGRSSSIRTTGIWDSSFTKGVLNGTFMILYLIYKIKLLSGIKKGIPKAPRMLLHVRVVLGTGWAAQARAGGQDFGSHRLNSHHWPQPPSPPAAILLGALQRRISSKVSKQETFQHSSSMPCL